MNPESPPLLATFPVLPVTVTVPSRTSALAAPAKTSSGTPSPRNGNAADLPSLSMQVRWIRDPRELEELLPAWQRLVDQAAEPNPFYGPGCLLPAWKHLGRDLDLGVAVVTAPPRVHPRGEPVLCGLFPLQLTRSHSGLPVRAAEFWRHEQCFLTTPLIRSDVLQTAWQTFWDWIGNTPLFGRRRCDWLSLPMQAGDGPLHGMLVDWLESQEIPSVLRRRYRRAWLRRPESYAGFLQDSVPRKLRQESGRLRRKLEQSGPLVVSIDRAPDRIADFMALEQSGWKGRSGTALASDPATRDFALAMAEQLSGPEDLQLLSLYQGEQLIASKWNLGQARGAFGWKIAYDEAFSAFSPGVLLELEYIRSVCENPGVDWVDSCADPDHPMIDHLWPERRPVESLLLACGSLRGRGWMAARPLLQQLRQLCSRRPRPVASQPADAAGD